MLKCQTQSDTYLELLLDKRLTWNKHLQTKRLTLNARMRMFRSLLIRNKHTTINITLLINKAPLRPMWTYGLQLWGPTKKHQHISNSSIPKHFSPTTFKCKKKKIN